MAECKPAAAPMEVNLKLEKLDAAEINATEYQQLIGSLMYGFIGTRFIPLSQSPRRRLL